MSKKIRLFEKQLPEILYESLAHLEHKAAQRDVSLSIPIASGVTILVDLDREPHTTLKRRNNQSTFSSSIILSIDKKTVSLKCGSSGLKTSAHYA
ncbi:MAG: hypothetical protein ACERK1_10975 [Anaerolineales bacterium]